ncbi:MAG: hypothetical protein AAFY72_14900, partial [Cyanobacteria bacterium J06649_4]
MFLDVSSPTQEDATVVSEKRTRHFIRVWVLTVLLSIVGIGGLNWLINPYGLYAAVPTVEGLNQQKPARDNHDRLIKAIEIVQQQPAHLVMGSSRVKQGIDPAHSLLPPDGYNAGLNGISSYELRRYVEHAIATQPNLSQITLGLDFFMFNGAVAETAGQTESDNAAPGQSAGISQNGFADYRLERSHLTLQDILATTLSIDALVASYETLQASRSSAQAAMVAGRQDASANSGFAPHGNINDEQTQWRFQHDLKIYFAR